ncbi:uncharacterized protein LOC136036875 isoform X3 [Artemia franciscana]|uniref:uncharacterized protein LOC136036875 isoform X3 n=2 Tax=Artemia franciscana TaxID=6661 RepID=UPI0032DBB857
MSRKNMHQCSENTDPTHNFGRNNVTMMLPRKIRINMEAKTKFLIHICQKYQLHSMAHYLEGFETEGYLGKGSFGVVFEAKSKCDKVRYAVKRISLSHRLNDDRKKALREAETLATLDHPNIVRYYTSWLETHPVGFYEDHDAKCLTGTLTRDDPDENSTTGNSAIVKKEQTYLFIQMELCEKQTLYHWLNDEKTRQNEGSTLKGLYIFQQVVQAIDYIHNRDIIHRDIKLAGCEYVFEDDIYSLGIILFELLIPFSTASERASEITKLKKMDFPSNFSEIYPEEKLLLEQMLDGDSVKRPVASTIAERIKQSVEKIKVLKRHLSAKETKETSVSQNRLEGFQQMFQENNLNSSFIFDCPPEMNSISYRLLHRLELNYCDSSDEEQEDSLESAKDIRDTKKNTTRERKSDISILLNTYLPRDNINVIELLFESRFSIPIYSKDTLELLRIARRVEENTFLGVDLILPRVAIISQVKRIETSTKYVMEDLFNLKTSLGSIEISGLEVGQGLVSLANRDKKSCIVIHIQGDFEPYWEFLNCFVDYLLVEDEYQSDLKKESSFISKYSSQNFLPKFITVWIPSLRKLKKSTEIDRRSFYIIEGPLKYLIEQKPHLRSFFGSTEKHEKTLYSISSFIKECSTPMLPFPTVDTLKEMHQNILDMNGLDNFRSNSLVLQKSFAIEGGLQDDLNEFRLKNDEKNRLNTESKIAQQKEFRKSQCESFFIQYPENNRLITYFLNGFQKSNIDHILLHFRVLDDAIRQNLTNSKIAAQLDKELCEKTDHFLEVLQKPNMGSKNEIRYIESIRKEYLNAKEKRNNAHFSLRHLWREVSLLYSSGVSRNFNHIPQMAAACLVAGETLELYDGDANMLNDDWVSAIFKNLSHMLSNTRIFVLSVLGEQSSGKSTLLNTMFGIRLATSIGQCTRGLSMTLVKTVNRKEYDYVLIFDTEGLRSPEHRGLIGSPVRDNKIATFSILPSDAVILVIKGENDNALKEILPIVALAYKGSRMAEENGGIVCCKIFAAYNQIRCDEGNVNKLQNIFSQLSATLVESFRTANSVEDLHVHTSVSFPTMFTNKQDIQVFGCNSKGDPPNDVPNEEFSRQIIHFREHIHNQVVAQPAWKAKKIESLDNYLFSVWECLKNSNFDLSFQTVLERHTYTELQRDYQELKKPYLTSYEEEYETLITKYKEDFSSKTKNLKEEGILKLVNRLAEIMKPQTDKFKKEVKTIVEKKGNEKWRTDYMKTVEDVIEFTTRQWRNKLDIFLRNLLFFDDEVKKYEKDIREKITEESRKTSIKYKTKEELTSIFENLFDTILKDAKGNNPPLDVREAVREAYKANPTIQSLGVDLLTLKESAGNTSMPSFLRTFEHAIKIGYHEVKKLLSQEKKIGSEIERNVLSIVIRSMPGRTDYSNVVVLDVISGIESYLETLKSINKSQRKDIHRMAYDLLVKTFEDIQKKWEHENSVYVRLCSRKETMRGFYFDLVRGLKEVELMESRLADFFSRHTFKAFEKEVEEHTIYNIKHKSWPQSARNMQGHMDLYLIEEVEKKGIKQILYHIEEPGVLKKLTTSRLIGFEIDQTLKILKWINFQGRMETCLQKTYETAPEDVGTGLKCFHISQLLKFLENFKSRFIGDTLKKEMNAIGWTDLEKDIKFEQRHMDCIKTSIKDSRTTGDMKSTLLVNIKQRLENRGDFQAGFCTACEKPCPLCNSPCFFDLAHNGPHDTFHQPGGLVGRRYRAGKKLAATACNTCPADHVFVLENGEEWLFTDFSKKFNDWLQPDRTKPVSEYREYLIRRYNKDIAKIFSVNPSDPLGTAEKLHNVTNKLKTQIDFEKDFPDKSLTI